METYTTMLYLGEKCWGWVNYVQLSQRNIFHKVIHQTTRMINLNDEQHQQDDRAKSNRQAGSGNYSTCIFFP
jgi:hypothetical protein